MSKKLIMLVLTVVSLILAFFVATQLLSTTSEKYLHYPIDFQGGAETKVFLVNSQLYYGVYDESFTRSGAAGFYSVNAGDPCVIISGTARNDYDKDYYFAITADVYNSEGEIIGPFGSEWPILTSSAPMPGFTVAHIHSGAVGSFKIQIKYDEEDIVRYDLFLAWQPTEIPPP